ncbi:lanthionine synthetase LanC family protein [Amycolatopsis anabasis]|uniref:lanthionine synthetase LanC family protein n=1 Tax=Amycolatopsis anabasis TaxID=1840409 RepID=UPI001FE2A41A|nr:lanthionine synthetase LanC family protein [Amycolatopsis anabasis]
MLAAARRVLSAWTTRGARSAVAPDPGPAVLSVLVAEAPGASVSDHRTSHDAIHAWLRGTGRGTRGVALFGGLAGVLAGQRLISDLYPSVAPAAERTAARLSRATAHRRWRASDVGFDDYDLLSGPAGLLLAHLVGNVPPRPGELAPCVSRLAELGSDADLTGFRIGAQEHPLGGWTRGGIVTGLAHGVAGALAALSAAPRGDRVTVRAIRNMACWLVAQRRQDDRGVAWWPRQVRAWDEPRRGEPRHHGWCRGSPGISWALWAAGRALRWTDPAESRSLCEIGLSSFRTVCAVYEEAGQLGETSLSDRLAICHGAAGVLLVADAFARHAALAPAAALRSELAGLLRNRLGDIAELGESDATLLTGATGVLAGLLTAGGAGRSWLRCTGLY